MKLKTLNKILYSILVVEITIMLGMLIAGYLLGGV